MSATTFETDPLALGRTWLLKALMLVVLPLVTQATWAQHELPVADASSMLSSDPVYKAWGTNSGVKRCGLCHYSPGNEFVVRETDFCGLSELKTWLEKDQHAISRQRIEPLDQNEIEQHRRRGSGTWFGESNYVSYKMCQALGYDVQSESGYAQFRDNCLTCHAGYEPHQPAVDFSRATPNRPGISCDYCHQIGDNLAWIDRHSGTSPSRPWRLLSPQDKAAAGMRDLVDTRAQAKLCTACHIGDQRRGMFVTHAMYVAGHPPLPNFELQTYVSSLPAHWREMRQTYESLAASPDRDAYFALNVELGKPGSTSLEDTFWETRTLLLGAVAVAEQSAAMLAEAGQHWGDYALYDCSACHHELRIPSTRQSRRGDEVPGRPRLLEWPTPLLSVALSLTDTSDVVSDARHKLSQALNATPFGNPAQCMPAALKLQNALQHTGEELVKLPIQSLQARRVFNDLANTTSEHLVSYHSARQVIWGIQLVDRELAYLQHPLNDAARKTISALGQQAQQTLVSTALPSGRREALYAIPKGQANADQVSYLAAELERIRRYDAEIIVQQLRELQLKMDENN